MTIIQLLIGSIIIEQLLQGLHEHPLWLDFKSFALRETDSVFVEGIIECKFCQSFWAGWVVGFCIVLWTGWSWDWLWAGPVMAFGANMVHGIRHAVYRIKSIGAVSARRIGD